MTQPLDRYFETQSQSQQFALVNGHRTLIDSVRGLALNYPIALWMLRLFSGDCEPTHADVVNIVVAMERGRGLITMNAVAKSVADSEQLSKLIVWYAR